MQKTQWAVYGMEPSSRMVLVAVCDSKAEMIAAYKRTMNNPEFHFVLVYRNHTRYHREATPAWSRQSVTVHPC